jgi:hypothetical protein
MASDLQRENPPTALLAGNVPCPLEAEADRAAEAGWRFSQVPDVYAAAARLLRTDRPRPDAVLVLVESLRGDELRFFDLLARRWPGLPVAAVYCLSAEDRRLEVCRRRDVTVLPAKGLADWLIAQGPFPKSPAARPPAVRPSPDLAASPSSATGSLPASALTQDAALGSEHSCPPAGVDVTLDLPDESVDPLSLDDAQADLPAQREYGDDDLPDLPDGPDVRDDLDHEEDAPPADDTSEDAALSDAEDHPGQVPLTPWSNVPRAQRRKPARPPPRRNGNGQLPSPPEKPAPPAAPSDSVTGSSSPAARRSRPAVRPSGWEHGLLTPDELRALLQDPDGTAGSQEDQP